MPGKLEVLRRLLATRPLQPIRDFLVRTTWRLDPEETALNWTVLDLPFNDRRKAEFLSWSKYDYLYRSVKAHLASDREWRQGPEKSWGIAAGPLKASKSICHKDLQRCRALDFGCGSHFSDSTALFLYLVGFQAVDSLELGETTSGFVTGATLDMIHWIRDGNVGVAKIALPDGTRVQPERLERIHEIAVLPELTESWDKYIPISIIKGDLSRLHFADNRYDLITSNAVLEHVAEPVVIWNELKRLLAPGGCMMHVVDFRDHRSYYEPGRFSPLPSRKHRKWDDPQTNGWGYSDWKSLVVRDSRYHLLESQTQLVDGSTCDSELREFDTIASWKFIVRREQ